MSVVPLIALTLVVSASVLSRADACDVQPADRNPNDIGIPMSPAARAVNDTFTFGPASERFYDYVEPLDGITLGFGNWPQQEVEGLFRDMSTANGGKAFEAFAGCAASFFAQQNHAEAWRAARMAARVGPLDPTRDNVTTVLRQTLLSRSFMARYKGHCKKTCRRGEPDLYHEHKTWLVPALKYALRDRDVIVWQVDFWTRTIVDRANELAEKVGLKDDEAAMVAAAAYRSSAPAEFNDVIRASRTGTLSFRGRTWKWDDPPTGARRDAEGLKRWQRLILWQHYANRVWARSQRIRARS